MVWFVHPTQVFEQLPNRCNFRGPHLWLHQMSSSFCISALKGTLWHLPEAAGPADMHILGTKACEATCDQHMMNRSPYKPFCLQIQKIWDAIHKALRRSDQNQHSFFSDSVQFTGVSSFPVPSPSSLLLLGLALTNKSLIHKTIFYKGTHVITP